MLIGIDASRALRAQRTGTENYSLQLIRRLLALDSQHRFVLYCDRPVPRDLFAGPGANFELCVIPLPRLWTHVRLAAEVTRHPPDVLFVPSHVLPWYHPCCSVVTVHDLGFRFFPQAHTRFDRWYLNASTAFNARSATCLLADSMATKADLARCYDVDPERVTVVYLGRDESLAPVEDPERIATLQQQLGITMAGRPCPYLLYVGTLQPRKNLARLVDAFAALRQRCSDLKLVLAGRLGWLSGELLQHIDALGLQDQVICPGFVRESDLPTLLSGARAFVFPSLYEGFGLPILEAQACGLPVVAANTSSLPEVAGQGALLIDPLDTTALAVAMEQVISDQALRRRLREAGFANCRRFSWDRCAQETLAVLEQCGPSLI